jgi:hypothetical protein
LAIGEAIVYSPSGGGCGSSSSSTALFCGGMTVKSTVTAFDVLDPTTF